MSPHAPVYSRVVIEDETKLAPGARHCSGCTLCCKLLPMSARSNESAARTAGTMMDAGLMTLAEATSMTKEFDKPAGKRCPHQRGGKGCAIYERRPFGCRTWTCRWLTNSDTADLSRPDRSHYVIDVMPDMIRVQGQPEGDIDLGVVVVWVDPAHPEAHRDPALRAFMLRRAEQEGTPTMVRFDSTRTLMIFPPPLASDGQWHEEGSEHATLMQREGHDLNPDNWTEVKKP